MNQIKRIDNNTVEIDGAKYARVFEAEFEKREWPTEYNPSTMLTGKSTIAYSIPEPLINKHVNITRCLVIARAINGDWEPTWEDDEQVKWCPYLFKGTSAMDYTDIDDRANSFVWFHSKEACQHFINHFGDIWLEAIG